MPLNNTELRKALNTGQFIIDPCVITGSNINLFPHNNFYATLSKCVIPKTDQYQIYIKPKDTLVIKVREFLHLTSEYYATIHEHNNLSEDCLLVGDTKVSSGYSGCLWLLVYNTADYSVKLDLTKPIAYLNIYKVN